MKPKKRKTIAIEVDQPSDKIKQQSKTAKVVVMDKWCSLEKEKGRKQQEVCKKKTLNVEEPTTKGRNVDVIHPQNNEEPITNVDVSNKHMEKSTTTTPPNP